MGETTRPGAQEGVRSSMDAAGVVSRSFVGLVEEQHVRLAHEQAHELLEAAALAARSPLMRV